MVATVTTGVLVGTVAGLRVAGEGESEAAEFLGGFNGWGALAIATDTLLLGWALTGRFVLRPLQQAWRRHRIGIHTWTSIIALAMAIIHSVGLFVRDDLRAWMTGAASLVLMGALFVTGWWRNFWVKHWGRVTWRWIHWELAVGAILLGFGHWRIIERLKGG